jgi:MOSC domain-containing protein YiiM
LETIEDLMGNFPRAGRVEWIGVRPERYAPLAQTEHVEVKKTGLVGDHRNKAGARAVTLIQAEHLPAIAAIAGLEALDPAILRRNIVISGINLLALRHRSFKLGSAILKGTELCAPCSRMEEALGPGGYNAMRGHGGLCAAVLEDGIVQTGDAIVAID